MTYEDKVLECYLELCDDEGTGASPSEVMTLMHEKGYLQPMDTVVDIGGIMTDLSRRGRL